MSEKKSDPKGTIIQHQEKSVHKQVNKKYMKTQ